MNNISMVESKLPPGFRFHPRDEELVCDYLFHKVSQLLSPNFHERETRDPLLIEVDLNKCEPWDLPDTACVENKQWYFYSRRDRKYATGLRTNRATATGYWKATGKDRAVLGKGRELVGMRKTLVFYQGRAPKGRKTEWVMHEFRLEGPFAPPQLSSLKEDWVLCRVIYKTSKETTTSATQRISNNDTGMITSYDHRGSASSLPPLMDHDSNNYITFNQSDHHQHEQVPCFSIFSQSQTTPNIHLPHTIATHMEQQQHQQPLNMMISNKINNFMMNPFGKNNNNENPDRNGTRTCLESVKVLNEMSNNNCIMKGDEQTCLLGGDHHQAGSSERYVSDVGIVHNMWNH